MISRLKGTTHICSIAQLLKIENEKLDKIKKIYIEKYTEHEK